MDITRLPFNEFIGIERALPADQLLTLPEGPQYLNHLGTVHASAQLALAEATSGEFLIQALGDAGDVLPVVRRLECKFRKPAHGALASTAGVEEGALEALRMDMAAKGRALIAVQVEVNDAMGAHVLSATVEWFITRMPDL
ncbi:MAG: hypothetical protein JWO08_4277 [Verrucomicrobiaceae bacterium]|nr:hypothetical protein [Verrucomicrobiaceae bacterium]